MSELAIRSITGFFFGTFLLGSILLDEKMQALAFLLFIILGLWEYFGLFKSNENYAPPRYLSTITGVCFYLIIAFVQLDLLDVFILKLIPPLCFCVLLSELFRKNNQPIIVLSLVLFPWIYFILPFNLMLEIAIQNKLGYVLLIGMFSLIWINDSMAYFIGKAYGKKPLFFRVSPNKTWEGTIGGFLFSFPAAVLIYLFSDTMSLSFWLIAALIISPCAVLGDLLESLFKRSLNIKDTGNILPGHGGILDRFDAVVFTVPFFYLWIEIYNYLF